MSAIPEKSSDHRAFEWEPHFEQYRRLLKLNRKERRTSRILFKIEKFWKWLGERTIQPSDLRPYHFVAYAQDLNSHKLCVEVEEYSPATVAIYLGAAKAWTQHLTKTGFLLQDPFVEFDAGHPKKPIYQRSLSKVQVCRILNSADTTTPWGLRDQALFEVIYGSGLRIGEASALTLESLDLGQRLLNLRNTKNGWDRCVPLTKAAWKSLIGYLNSGRPELSGPRSGSSLWLNYKGEPLSCHAPVTLAARTSAALGFKFTMHGLRHACATHLLEGGASLRLIGELLGHSNIESTTHYARACLDELKNVHFRTHPRSGHFGGWE